jgi:hypothetical protein
MGWPMADGRLDVVARHVGGRDQHEGNQHQQRGKVAHQQRRIVNHGRGEPSLAVTPYQQHESRNRQQCVCALPAVRPHARNGALAPVLGKNTHRVCAEKNDEAEDERSHEISLRFMQITLNRQSGCQANAETA